MAEMNRFRIEHINVISRGDGEILIRKPNRRTERARLSKIEVNLLKEYFRVDDWRDLKNKVFEFNGQVNFAKNEKYIINFIKTLQ